MLRFLALAALVGAASATAAPVPDPPAGLPAVAFTNDTGMTVLFLYVAGCGESEGNDWSDMASWATDTLGDDVLAPGASHTTELADGCYVVEPHDGPSASRSPRTAPRPSP